MPSRLRKLKASYTLALKFVIYTLSSLALILPVIPSEFEKKNVDSIVKSMKLFSGSIRIKREILADLFAIDLRTLVIPHYLLSSQDFPRPLVLQSVLHLISFHSIFFVYV